MSKTVGRLKSDSMAIGGDINERVPIVQNNLVQHLPLDGYVSDIFTEQKKSNIVTTTRDYYGSYFTSKYDYKNATFRISGRVRCTEAADWNAYSFGIGFRYKYDASNYTWPTTWRKPLNELKDWVYFDFEQTIGSNYDNGLIPFLQISISGGTPGYRVEVEDLVYRMEYESFVGCNVSNLGDRIGLEQGTANISDNYSTANIKNGSSYIEENGIRKIDFGALPNNFGGWYFNVNYTYLSGDTWTFSFQAENRTGENKTLQFYGASDGAGRNFGDVTIPPHTKQHVSITITMPGAVTSFRIEKKNWAGAAGEFLIWHMQAESLGFPTSYVESSRGTLNLSIPTNLPLDFSVGFWMNGFKRDNITRYFLYLHRSDGDMRVGNGWGTDWNIYNPTANLGWGSSSVSFPTDDVQLDDMYIMLSRFGTRAKVRIFYQGVLGERTFTENNNAGLVESIELSRMHNNQYWGLSVYDREISDDELKQLCNTKMSIKGDGRMILPKYKEDINYLEKYMGSYFHNTGEFTDGWNKQLQAEVAMQSSKTVEHKNSNYSIYIQTTPNKTQGTDGNVMWGGLRLSCPEEIKKPGKWKISFWYKGHIEQSYLGVYYSYNVGYTSQGVGLRAPASKSIAPFSTDEWQYYEYIYTLTKDDIYQIGTNAQTYDCMRELKIGPTYGSTGARGTRIFIDRISVSPVLDGNPGVKKDRVYYPKIKEGIDMHSIHIIGTAYDDASGVPVGAGTTGNKSIKVNDTEYASNTRGLTLCVFDKNMNHVSTYAYDTYGSDADRNALATALDGIKEEESWALASFDAQNFNTNLNNQLTKMNGKIHLDLATAGRHTYAAWGKGQFILFEDGSESTSFDDHKAVIKKTI